MSADIILADKPVLPVFSLTPEALATRDEALANAALIGKVENPDQNKRAVEAHIFLKRVASTFEKARKTLKEPLIEAGRQLDRAVAKELADVEKEIGRVEQLTAAFQLAEARRVREEQEAQARELARIEAEKNAALATATTPEQVQSIQETAQAKIMAEAKPITAARTHGQVIKEDWEVVVINPYELAKFHPDCVLEIKPALAQIKSYLNQGMTIRGVKATKVTKAQVRAGAGTLIDV